jgi:magnesium-transporting ATPase (P-type)
MNEIFELNPPTFLQRCKATWIDAVLLLGAYLIFGFSSKYLFDVNAYPPPTSMQFYSERDFHVFWFFVTSTIVLFISYRIWGQTVGQRLAGLHVLSEQGGRLTSSNIVRRILIVLLRLFLIFIPGPVAAIIFISFASPFLNPAFSMALLVGALLVLLYRSYTKYNQGKTRSLSDRLSGTIVHSHSNH